MELTISLCPRNTKTIQFRIGLFDKHLFFEKVIKLTIIITMSMTEYKYADQIDNKAKNRNDK